MNDTWRELYETEYPRLLRALLAIGGDPAAAEDAAQEAFVRAFRALDRFDVGRSSSIRPWLLSIAANLAHNRRRALKRYLAALGRWARAAPEQTTSIGERTAQQWEAQTLWEAVRRLKPAEQEVVYMRYFLDLSEAEMAFALRVAPGTVKSRLHRAMQRLRSVVDQEFPALREERQT